MQCPVCDSKSGFTEVERFRNFKIWRCEFCELQFSDPMSYDGKLYDQLYSDSRVTRSHKYSGFALQLDRWGKGIPKGQGKYVLKSYERLAITILQQHFSREGYILDIGCGAGRFLSALRDWGFQPLGMDIALEPVRVLGRLGFDVTCGTIENYPKEWPVPKAITVFEVLEHLSEPLDFLSTLANQFFSSLLILSVPSPKRWFLWRGKREPEDYPPNHLTRWTEKALQIALGRAGYTKIEIKFLPVKPTEITGSGLGEIMSLLTSSPVNVSSREDSNKEKYWIHPVKTERCLGFVKKVLYAPLAWYLNARGFSGASMLALAER